MAKKKKENELNLDEEMIENIKHYGSTIKSIDSFVEAVRKIPGMYIGPKGNPGFINMIREIFQNSIDQIERPDSPADSVMMIYDERTNEVTVQDNGTGIPFGQIIKIFTSQHTSGNYEKPTKGQYSAGVHGVGSKVTNALSSVFIVESYILGDARRVEFYDGVAWDKGELKIPNDNNLQGTKIYFRPCYEIMGEITSTVQDVFSLVSMILPLTKIGTKIGFYGYFKDGKVQEEHLVNEDGIIANLIWKTSTPIIKPIVMNADNGDIKADIAFTFDSDNIAISEDISLFGNFCPTNMGTHLNGFVDGLTKWFRDYMNKIYLKNSKKLSIISADIRTGLRAIVSVSHLEPVFTGQAKEILSNEDIYPFVKNLVITSLEQWSKDNSNDLQKICKYFKEIAEIRSKSEDTKVKLSNQYKSTALSQGMPAKFVSASGKAGLELLIVEGDSALGSARNSKEHKTQALFPIRGKIANSFTTTKAKLLENEEVASIITILGGGYGKNFNVEQVKKKWDKVVICADADRDGDHIRSLLLRFFILYMPQLIEEGMVYSAMPPLFGLQLKGDKHKYFTTKVEYTLYVQKEFIKKHNLVKMDGSNLTNNERTSLFVKNIDYVYELDKVANTYAINPWVLEDIIIESGENDYKKFKRHIEKKYRFLKVSQKNGIVIIEGLVDGMYQTIFLNNELREAYSHIRDILNSNTEYYYMLNGIPSSIYTIMKEFENSSPDRVTRYKGLGEMNPQQLADSTLLPENRTLIQYTIEDVKREIEAIRYMESDRSRLLKDLVVTRQDIE